MEELKKFEKGMKDASAGLNFNFDAISKVFSDAEANKLKEIKLPRLNGAQKDASLQIVDGTLCILRIDDTKFPKQAGVMYQIPKEYAPKVSVGVMEVRNSTDNISPIVLRIDGNGNGSVRILGNVNDTQSIYGLAVWAINKEEA